VLPANLNKYQQKSNCRTKPSGALQDPTLIYVADVVPLDEKYIILLINNGIVRFPKIYINPCAHTMGLNAQEKGFFPVNSKEL